MGERVLLMIGIFFLALGPVMLYPCSGPTPPLKYSDVGPALLGTVNETLLEQLTFNYGWLSVPISMTSHDVSG